MILRAAAALLLTCGAVAACASDDPAPSPPVVFVCPGGAVLLASFDGPDSMRLQVGGRVYELPRLISASGARYGDGPVVFWNKGREALFHRPDGTSYTGCVAQ